MSLYALSRTLCAQVLRNIPNTGLFVAAGASAAVGLLLYNQIRQDSMHASLHGVSHHQTLLPLIANLLCRSSSQSVNETNMIALHTATVQEVLGDNLSLLSEQVRVVRVPHRQ